MKRLIRKGSSEIFYHGTDTNKALDILRAGCLKGVELTDMDYSEHKGCVYLTKQQDYALTYGLNKSEGNEGDYLALFEIEIDLDNDPLVTDEDAMGAYFESIGEEQYYQFMEQCLKDGLLKKDVPLDEATGKYQFPKCWDQEEVWTLLSSEAISRIPARESLKAHGYNVAYQGELPISKVKSLYVYPDYYESPPIEVSPINFKSLAGIVDDIFEQSED